METLKGYVSGVVYRNEENAYTVFEITTQDGTVPCTGFPAAIAEGESCILTGQFTTHPIYGKQFQMKTYTVCEPEGTQAVFRYLSSGAVKGIGAALAGRIIAAFGDDTMRILDEEPERLAEVKGISERKAREIAAAMEGKKDLRDAMIFLQKYGIGGRTAVRIWQSYGLGLYGILKENPYRLAEDIDGIGFAKADELAGRIGIAADSEFRFRSALLYVLTNSVSEGHTYLPSDVLIRRTAGLLRGNSGMPLSLPPQEEDEAADKVEEELRLQLGNLVVERRVQVRRKGEITRIYSTFAWYEEQESARLLLLLRDSGSRSERGEEVLKEIRALESREGIRLDELQTEAVREAMRQSVLLICGGPGTGKTTTINAIIGLLMARDLNVCLAAPTGRAAKRMSAVSGYEATTIHRLLGVQAGSFARDDDQGKGAKEIRTAGFLHDEQDPLDADAVIIDEMSMVDIHLFHSLVKALRPGTKLIMVGDPDQLPSVGPGRVLQDILDSGAFPAIRLQKIFRQAAESDIVMNAHRILSGEPLQMNNRSKDFFFLERERPEVIYKHMVELMRDRLPGYLGCRTDEIQVLTPMRKGMLGAERLNEVLQSVLNPPSKEKAEIAAKEVLFREGDKVMQIRNNYQLEWEIRGNFGIPVDKGAGVFNGDFGTVESIDKRRELMEVKFDDERIVTYQFSELEDLDLAYAITVHKSQGSEYPGVILPLLDGPPALFTRNLLYTAVTRARGCVVILGSRETVMRMEHNTSGYTRYSGLSDRIRDIEGATLSAQMPGM